MLKRIKILSILFFLVCSLSAHAKETLVITGHFKNFRPDTDGDIMPSVLYYGNDLTRKMKTCTLDSSGTFRFEIPKLHKTQLVNIQIQNYIYGKFLLTSDLHLSFDVKKTVYGFNFRPNVSFSGTDANSAKHFFKYANRYSINQPRKVTKKDTLTDSELQLALFQHHQKAMSGIPKNIQTILNELYDLEKTSKYLSTKRHLPVNDSLLTSVPQYLSWSSFLYQRWCLMFYLGYDTETQIKMTARIVNTTLKEEQLVAFNQFIEAWRLQGQNDSIDSLIKQGRKTYYTPNKLEIYKLQVSHFKKKLIELTPTNINELIVSSIPISVEERKIHRDSLRAFITGDWAFKEIDKNVKSDREAVEIVKTDTLKDASQHPLGVQVYKNDSIAMYINNRDNINLILANIQKEHPNKIIVVDIWTTWCGPCISDMKASKKNKKKLKANDIEVVYICDGTASSAATWIQKVRGMGTVGNHILINTGQRSQLFAQFGFTGYPSYLVIDKDGKYYKDKIHRITYIKANTFANKLK